VFFVFFFGFVLGDLVFLCGLCGRRKGGGGWWEEERGAGGG